jgi:hypothetical protein
MLRPGGKVFFVDSRREPTSTAADHQLPEPGHQVMTRKLNDGRDFEIVKNFYDPGKLISRCIRAGLEMTVRETATYFDGRGRPVPDAPGSTLWRPVRTGSSTTHRLTRET